MSITSDVAEATALLRRAAQVLNAADAPAKVVIGLPPGVFAALYTELQSEFDANPPHRLPLHFAYNGVAFHPLKERKP